MATERAKQALRLIRGEAISKGLGGRSKEHFSTPGKIKARSRVFVEERAGRMNRPSKCQSCGASPGTGSDGRNLIQAHHGKGYKGGNATNVKWLCPKCNGNKTAKE